MPHAGATRVSARMSFPIRGTIRSFLACAAAMAGFLALAACTTNPATGARQITPIMSPADEARAGAELHPKILKAFGGAYGDEKLGAYVAGVTSRIVRATNRPDEPYRVTVLDTPAINAFALPGGYVYVTRGLIALANDEAELASVIGHEIGHVAARHSAQRHTAAVGTSILGAVLGAVVGSQALNQAFGLGGQGFLANYSRDQEYEADMLGIRYLAGAGYDPYSAADFLESMGANEALEAKLRGVQRDGTQTNWLASHPATPARVEAALAHARETGIRPGGGARGRDTFLSAINGMLYGDNPSQGIVRDRLFIHPELRFAFEAPPGFVIVNGATAVTMQGPERSIAKFDMGKKAPGDEIGSYLSGTWAAGVRIGAVERFTINGMKAAAAPTRIGDYDARLVTIEFSPDQVGRFILGTLPQSGAKYMPALQETVRSFRRISAAEAKAVKPLRLRLLTARSGDSITSLSQRMIHSEHKADRFRVLNGLASGEQVVAGRRYKIIAE